LPEKIAQALQSQARRLLSREKAKGKINLVFVDKNKMQRLNHQFRKINKVTDVLSFESDERNFLGEIIICVEQAQKQARQYKVAFGNECKRLLTHGMLHLAGYDHLKAKGRKLMRQKEEFYA